IRFRPLLDRQRDLPLQEAMGSAAAPAVLALLAGRGPAAAEAHARQSQIPARHPGLAAAASADRQSARAAHCQESAMKGQQPEAAPDRQDKTIDASAIRKGLFSGFAW